MNNNVVVDNPYFAFCIIELYNEVESTSYLINQSSYMISLEIQRFYQNIGSSTCKIDLVDPSGGYELETQFARFKCLRIQYGYHNGAMSPILSYQIMKAKPDLDGGISKLSVEGIMMSYVDNKKSIDSGTYGGTDESGQDILISDIVSSIAKSTGWKIGHIEPTKPIKDVRGFNRSFTRSQMTPVDFIKYELAPYAISSKTGAGGYVVILDSQSSTTDNRISDTYLSFLPMSYKLDSSGKSTTSSSTSISSTTTNSTYTFDVRTPSGVSYNKVISFTPDMNLIIPGLLGTTTVVGSSDTTDPSGYSMTDRQSHERLESYIPSKYGEVVRVDSTISNSESESMAKSMQDSVFSTSFRAELEVQGNPHIYILDIIEVNYIMANNTLHHSSGQYIVGGVIDRLNGGSYTTQLSLLRGTDINQWSTNQSSSYTDANIGYTGVAPDGGYRLPSGNYTYKNRSINSSLITNCINQLVKYGLSLRASCHLVGGFIQESNINPQLQYTDAKGTLVYRHTPDGKVIEGSGFYSKISYGINQWHDDRRFGFGKGIHKKYPLADVSMGNNKNGVYVDANIPHGYSTVPQQVDYVYKELAYSNRHISARKYLMKSNPSYDDCRRGCKLYTGYGIEGVRSEIAEDLYKRLAGQSISTPSTGSITTADGKVIAGSLRFQSIRKTSDTRLSSVFNTSISPSSNQILYPIKTTSRVVTSGYGPRRIQSSVFSFHSGMDLRGSKGDLVMSMMSGRVIQINTNVSDPLGYYVVIQHDSRTTITYGHLNSISVSNGATVSAGTPIGTVGNSGLGSINQSRYAPHLHITLKQNGAHISPEAIICSLLGASWKDPSTESSNNRRHSLSVIS